MDAIFSTQDIAKITQGTHHGPDTFISGFSIDTRTLKNGQMFLALKGGQNDGHQYLDQAFKNGAHGALIDQNVKMKKNQTFIQVPNVLKALEKIGQHQRALYQGCVVGITGSVGKTSIKEALGTLIEHQGPCYRNKASFNNHLGVPLSLAHLSTKSHHAIFEMGMNHAGEINPLALMVHPQIVLITTVTQAHRGFFKDEREIALAKSEIFNGSPPPQTAVLNKDNIHYDFLCQQAVKKGIKDIVTFGQDHQAHVRLVSAQSHCDYNEVCAHVMGKEYHYRFGIPGQHWVMNSLAILAIMARLELDLDQACENMRTLSAMAQRGQKYQLHLPQGQAILIDDSFNANPSSMEAALNYLQKHPSRRIAILGDMQELGDQSVQYHQNLAPHLKKCQIDQLFCHGPHMKELSKIFPAIHRETIDDLLKEILDQIRPQDTLLVKGSFYSYTHRISQALIKKFSSHSSS